MRRTTFVVLLAVLLATIACFLNQESCLDKQIRLVNERIALYGHTIDDCGK